MWFPARRLFSTAQAGRPPVVRVVDASIFAPGASHRSVPAISNLNWTVNDGEAWTVIENDSAPRTVGGKSAILQLLLGHMRISPAGIDPLPFLNGQDSREVVHSVAFSTRPKSWGGGFYDYTSRYGAARGEDARTFRHVLRDLGAVDEEIDKLATRLEVHDLLDLPLVALSNGQTRRARVMQALLRTPHPKLLLLDEPLTGLDPHARPVLSELLRSLHESNSPRIIMALRAQDPLPEWITHVLKVSDGRADTVKASEFVAAKKDSHVQVARREHAAAAPDERPPIVQLKNVNVKYHERHVLRDVSWTILPGEKWHLQGYNGSGKTTLTSLLTGAHPQSYTNPGLFLFNQPRRKIPTPILAQRIGHTSPEIAAALPRRASMTVADLISTGYEGHFAFRPRSTSELARVQEVATALGLTADKSVIDLTPGEFATALMARAMVAKPELAILDEAFMGMTSAQVERATRWLREESGPDQAVVWIGHWESECPWSDDDYLRVVRLDSGSASVLHAQPSRR